MQDAKLFFPKIKLKQPFYRSKEQKVQTSTRATDASHKVPISEGRGCWKSTCLASSPWGILSSPLPTPQPMVVDEFPYPKDPEGMKGVLEGRSHQALPNSTAVQTTPNGSASRPLVGRWKQTLTEVGNGKWSSRSQIPWIICQTVQWCHWKSPRIYQESQSTWINYIVPNPKILGWWAQEEFHLPKSWWSLKAK